MELEYSICHEMIFTAENDGTWPDVRWPEWKPNTDKMMRPGTVTTSIRWTDNEKLRANYVVHVEGSLILKSGDIGKGCKNDYYTSSASAFPEFLTRFKDEAYALAQAKYDAIQRARE